MIDIRVSASMLLLANLTSPPGNVSVSAPLIGSPLKYTSMTSGRYAREGGASTSTIRRPDGV
jgi:hypothetical protein